MFAAKRKLFFLSGRSSGSAAGIFWDPYLCLCDDSSSFLWVHSSRWLLHCTLHCARAASNVAMLALLNRWPLPQAGLLSSFLLRGLQEQACSSCSCTFCCAFYNCCNAAW